MEAGINLVTVVENDKGARVAVTLNNTATPNLSLNNRTLPFTTSKSIESQKCQVSSTAQTDKVKQPTVNNGIQIYDDRFISSYQVAHCHVRPTSPPLVPTEFPQLLSAPKTKNEKRHRVTRDPDYFVDNLRKYPQVLTDLDSSSELIERVLSATLSKRVNKERVKHLGHRSKRTKENASKTIQTYTRSRKETKNNVNAGNHIIMATAARRSSSPMSWNHNLRRLLSELGCGFSDTSPRVQRMGRVAEIRYLTDVRKCIRDAIKHVWEENEMVCPNIQERFVVHQQQHHNPSSNKDEIIQSKSKDVKAQKSPDRREKSKICPICLNILPCHCRKKAKSIIRDDVANCTNLDNQSSNNSLTSNSCCVNCQEKREYKMKVFKQVLEWMQQIPFDANCSCDDKTERLSIMSELINSLVEFRGMEGKQKEEIKKYLDIMPMWQPTDQFDRDLFLNIFVENLVARLNGLWNDNSLKEIVSNWINETLSNKMPYRDTKAKDRMLHTIIDRIKSLKLDEIAEKNKAKQLLEKNIKDILKDIPLDQTSDVNFLEKAANTLVTNITVTLPIDNSTIISTSEIDYTNPVIKLNQENRQWSNFNDKQIILNNLENSKEYYKFHKQTQTSNSIDSIVNNKEKFVEAQTIQRYVEKKLLNVLEELRFNINANSKERFENEILRVISKNSFSPSPLIKMEATEHDSVNRSGANTNFNHSVLLSELQTRQENIQDYVEKEVASILNQYGIKYHEEIKMKNELTDLLTDQIIRGDNPESVKNTACSILREINISESQAEELCNTILQHIKNTSLIPHDTTLVWEKNLSSYQNKNDLLGKTEREIIHFINENTGLNDPVTKQKILKSIKILAKDIKNLISSTKPCTKDKENLITNKVLNFFKREIFPSDETLHTFAKALAKRLLLIPLQSSTPKAINDEYIRHKVVSPTISIYHQVDEHNNEDNESFKENNEKIYLDIISKEVSKWVEKLPSDYKLSQDTRHHEMLVKELAKKVLISLANPSLNPDLVLNREIQQWLPKIIKEPNQANLKFLTEDVKETIKQKLQADVNLIPKPHEYQNHFTENLKHIILDWLRKSQTFQNRNMQENILRESLVSNLARDINNIMLSNVSASNIVNTDEQVLKAIQTRIKQFTMDPELKYNEKYKRDLSRQLLNSLKKLSMDKGTNTFLGEVNENSKLALISIEILRWIENIPSNYKISNNKHHHKMLAKEIAKRVLASMSSPNANYNSLLDCEIFQWLPKIVKPLNDADLQFLARDLKETIKQKLPFKDILLPKSQDNANNLTEDLKENILDWLKMTQMHHTENMQGSLVSILARDLYDIICAGSSTDSGINKGELIMKIIRRYIKEITIDPKLKNNDKYIREMAFQLLNHMIKIPYKKVNDASFEECNEKSKSGLISNEVLKWIENIPSSYKLSQDKHQHKVLAKEIAKKIMAPILIPNSKSDSFLERELMQWLPNIVKYSNQGELQLLAEDLKKTIQQQVPSDVISISKSTDNLNIYTKKLKKSIIDWLKNSQKEHKISSQENLLCESLASNLARDLNNIILTNKSVNSTINMDEQMMRAIQTRIKQFTKDPKLKYNDKYTREMSFQLLNHLKQLHFDKETDISVVAINENIQLGAISNEVFKWMENIPSNYKLSHDKDHLKVLAKEISKKVQTPTLTPISDLVLEREILQWLPKILKKLNEADLQLVTQDLKETIKPNLPTDVISIWKFSDNPNQFTENIKDIIMCWLHNAHIYKTGNSQEELFQKSLISNLAKDLNDIICISSSTDSTVNKDELMMKAIQTRIKQFTMDPQLKYNENLNQELALELLKHLKQLPFDRAIDASLEKLNEDTKLGVVSNEIFRWIQNVPSDYKVSSNKHHHKILAKEIAKRVQSTTFSSNSNYDSLLEHELLQWLPKITKYSTESDLQFVIKDLKETIKRKLPVNVISVSKSPGRPNLLTNTLKRNILGWLKNTQTYQTRNMQEKHLQECLVSNLAKDLNDILCDKNFKDSNVSNNELMLNAIETYIKKFPMEPKLKYNDKHHHKMALELLKYINKSRNQKSYSLIRDNLKSTISRWLHNLPLTSTPDYQNASDKLCSLFSMVLGSNFEDYDTKMYLQNEVINLLQDLPLNEDFRSYDKLQTLADKLIKSLQYVPKAMDAQENLIDEHTNINNGVSTLNHAVISYEQIPVTNTYDKNVDKQNSHSSNINKENYLLYTKFGQNETNTADKTITANTIVQNEEISHQQFESGEIPVDLEDQHKNRKNVEEIQKQLTRGLINILDKLSLNSNLANETVDENILKHDIENLIDVLSKNVEHKKILLPLKQDVVNISKEIVEINKKLLAEKDLKILLHGVIDNTLPTSSHFSKQKTSFEDLKEKLIDAFINLNKISNINTHKYKEDLKKEVNKFCHAYLQRFPATPVNADQLCEDLYTVLQNVSFPKDKSISLQIDRNNIEDEVELFLNQLPLQDNEKNNMLKKEFVKSLVNNLCDLMKKHNFEKKFTNLEGLIREKFEQFSFNSGEIPNIQELTKDIIQRLESQEAKKRDKNNKDKEKKLIMHQIKGQYSDPRESQLISSPGLSPIGRNVQRLPANVIHQTQIRDIDENNQRTSNIGGHTDMSEFEISMNNSKSKLQKRDKNLIRPVTGQYFDLRGLQPKISAGLFPIERNVQRFPANVKLQAQTKGIDDNNQRAINIGVQTDMTSKFEISMHTSKTKLPDNRYKGIDHDLISVSPVPSKSIQNLYHQNFIKENLRRPHETTNHEVSPRIVIKEYHWDSTTSSQLNNLQAETQIKQNQLRRTVPSLPLTETKIPLAPLDHPKQHINRNPLHPTYSQLPYRFYKTATESNYPTMFQPMNNKTLETVPSPTRIPPSNINNKYRHSCLKLIPINIGKPESFSAKTFEHRKQKPKFRNDQFIACSKSNLLDANSIINDAQYNENICRNCVGSIPTNDMDMATINHKNRKHGISQSCCNCFKYKSKKLQDKVTDISNNLNSCHQRTANLAQCEKCRGTACPHPSYFYFS